MKFFYLFIFLISTVWANEPSVFQAGALDKKDPYGLTQTEQYILTNKKAIARATKDLNKLQNSLEALEPRLQSLSDVLLGTTKKQQQNIFDNKSFLDNLQAEIQALQAQMASNKALLEERIVQNTQVLTDLKFFLKELTDLSKTINQDYINKAYLEKYVQEQIDAKLKANAEEASKAKALKLKQSATASSLKGKTGSQLLKEVEALLSAKKYEEMKPIAQRLIDIKHRPARNNFYLGEAYFYTKEYKNALVSYKKSASLYQKADYMPKLLLHAGIASSRTGNKKDAQNFYQSVVNNFPKSNQAKEAKRYIQ